MSRITRFFGGWIVALAACTSVAAGAERAPDVDPRWLALLAERDAGLRGDKVTWAKHVSTDSLWIGSGLQLGRFADAQGDQVPVNVQRERSDLVVHDYGSVAVLSYLLTDRVRQGEGTRIVRMRKLDTYARLDGEWKLVACAESFGGPPRRRIAVTPSLYDELAGDYVYAEGAAPVHTRVWRDGDRLMIQTEGQSADELLPESERVFFSATDDGEGSPDNVFERGPDGRVVAYVYRAAGVEFRSRKLP